MCLYPKLIKNRKYIKNKKNGGNIPAVRDKRVLYVPVGCQKCIECRKQKGRAWNVRLHEEQRTTTLKGYFVTLTYNTEELTKLTTGITADGYTQDNEIAKLSVRRFLERWRKEHKRSVRHWFITELGAGRYEHLHLHGLIWTNENPEKIAKHWKYGYVFIGDYVNERTINYITKYLHKTDEKHKEYTPIVLTSAGIGKSYTNRLDSKRNKYNGENTRETYENRQGYKQNLPIYYRNKLYTETERELLWLDKLNKKVRYVLGVKIDISKDEEEYYKALYEARKLNKLLGYGNDEIDWDKRKYENERRNLIYKKRNR